MMKLYTDGGARGNPGPGASGVIIKSETNEVIFEYGEYLGTTTNNEAEYRALLLGLEKALEQDIKEIECYLDSELVVKQLNGEYKVKSNTLRPFYTKVVALKNEFVSIKFFHIKRALNKEADAIVNKVLDSLD